MKKFLAIAVAVMMMAAFSDAQAAGASVRVGGGVIFDGKVPGGGAAVDIKVGEGKPVAISPFFEFYRKSGVSSIPVGVNLLYMAPVAEEKAEVYFGAGGGMLRISNGGSETAFLIDGVGGVKIKMSDQVGIYIEGKYLYAKKSGVKLLNDIAASVGISFNIGAK